LGTLIPRNYYGRYSWYYTESRQKEKEMKPENFKEIKIIPIDLNNLDLPSDRLCMVMTQPFLKLQRTEMGFKIDRSILRGHKRIICSTLQLVCRLRFGNASYNTNFMVFPELSLPFGMISEIKYRISDSWPHNSILIGGIEGISVAEYRKIIRESDNPMEANYELLGTTNYVNCAAVFVKENKGSKVKLYLQPKIKPSRWEQAIGMREGRHIFIFISSKLNFLCLTCFDAISADLEFKLLASGLMRNLKEMAVKKQIPNVLDMVFILMHNEKPHDRNFQESVYQILNGGGRELRSDHGSVVFVNTANSEHGSSNKFGKSAFYFRRGAWYIPPKKEYPPPDTYRIENTECECQRARFREDGPSLHYLCYIPYTSVPHTQGGRWYPFKEVAWCRINPDSTLSSPQSVPAIRKFVMDNLPQNLNITDNRWRAPNDQSLAVKMGQNYNDMRERLISVELERIKELIDLLLLPHFPEDDRTENPDYWKIEKEGEAIREMTSILSILTLLGEIELRCSRIVSFKVANRFYVAITDGHNERLPFELWNRYIRYIDIGLWTALGQRADVLLVLSRHRREGPPGGIANEISEILKINLSDESTLPAELQDRDRFTSYKEPRLFWQSANYLQGILDENDIDSARAKLEERLEPLRD